MKTNDIPRLCQYLKPDTLAAIILDLHDSRCGDFTQTAEADVQAALIAIVGEEEACELVLAATE